MDVYTGVNRLLKRGNAIVSGLFREPFLDMRVYYEFIRWMVFSLFCRLAKLDFYFGGEVGTHSQMGL